MNHQPDCRLVAWANQVGLWDLAKREGVTEVAIPYGQALLTWRGEKAFDERLRSLGNRPPECKCPKETKGNAKKEVKDEVHQDGNEANNANQEG